MINNSENKKTLILFLVITIYMGLRPISGKYFGDMGTYKRYFENYAEGREIQVTRDVFWNVFMKFCSVSMNIKTFFLLCAFLYITPLYLACKKWLNRNNYVLFLMLIASFSFWAYGTNGIRNGIATSFFIYALSFNKRVVLKYLILLLSFSIHASLIIPISALVISTLYKNTKHFFLGWLLVIPLSLILGGFWESLFASIGFGDDRLSYLTQGNINNDDFAYTGFRWDFLIYSSLAILYGWFYILKKNFQDGIYIQIFNIYIIANAFWILVIRANFSNRFAYLSWFLMAVVIFYPLFKKKFFAKQNYVLAFSIFIYFGFTYFMSIFL